jgi:hypothetical protein
MDQLLPLLAQHPTVDLMVAGYFLIAAVETMPEAGDPRPLGTKLYAWFYSFMHLVMNKVEAKYPQLQTPNGQTKEIKQ